MLRVVFRAWPPVCSHANCDFPLLSRNPAVIRFISGMHDLHAFATLQSVTLGQILHRGFAPG